MTFTLQPRVSTSNSHREALLNNKQQSGGHSFDAVKKQDHYNFDMY